jgi:hypothetical protein
VFSTGLYEYTYTLYIAWRSCTSSRVMALGAAVACRRGVAISRLYDMESENGVQQAEDVDQPARRALSRRASLRGYSQDACVQVRYESTIFRPDAVDTVDVGDAGRASFPQRIVLHPREEDL